MKRKPVISLTWEEGMIWDLWMIVHFLSGVSLGALCVYWRWESALAFAVIFAGTVLWEIFEIMLDIEETAINRTGDVVIAMVGAALAYQVLKDEPASVQLYAFFASLFANLFFAYRGWVNFQKRRRKKAPSE